MPEVRTVVLENGAAIGFLAPGSNIPLETLPALPAAAAGGAAAAAASGLLVGGVLGQWLYDHYPPEVLFSYKKSTVTPPDGAPGWQLDLTCNPPNSADYTVFQCERWSYTNGGYNCTSWVNGNCFNANESNSPNWDTQTAWQQIHYYRHKTGTGIRMNIKRKWHLVGARHPAPFEVVQTVVPMVSPWPDPWGLAAPGHPYAPAPDPNMPVAPSFDPIPKPNQEPSPAPEIAPAPQRSASIDGHSVVRYEISSDPAVSPPHRPPPPDVAARPPQSSPRRGEKEKKTRGKGMNIAQLLDLVSESAEVVDAVYEALPDDVKRRWGRDRKERPGDQMGQYGLSGADWKLQAIWHNWDKIDAKEAVSNIIRNEIEDRLYGRAYGGMDRMRPRNSTRLLRS